MAKTLQALLLAGAALAFTGAASAQEGEPAAPVDPVAAEKNAQALKNFWGATVKKAGELKDGVVAATTTTATPAAAGTPAAPAASSSEPGLLSTLGNAAKGALKDGSVTKAAQRLAAGDKAGAAVVAVDAAASAAKGNEQPPAKAGKKTTGPAQPVPSAATVLDLYNKFKK